MNAEKIIGYFLLVAGVGVILASTFLVYQVFTGQKKAPVVFSFEMPEISLPAQQSLELDLPEGLALPEGLSLPANLGKSSSKNSELKLLPDDLINKVVNMSVYLFLMGFVASSGAKLASIGVKMIKDVKVVVKEKKLRVD